MDSRCSIQAGGGVGKQEVNRRCLVRVFVLDPHPFFRQGLVACLRTLDNVGSVAEAADVVEASEHPGLEIADIVLIDYGLPYAAEFLRTIREKTEARVVAHPARCGEDSVLQAVEA